MGVAIKEQREERAWTEGVAIWVAVLVVSSVGKLATTWLHAVSYTVLTCFAV